MNIKKYIKISCLLTIFLVLCGVAKTAHTRVQKLYSVTYAIDSRLSNEITAQIKQCIEEHATLSASKLYHVCHQHFPCIDTFSVQLVAPYTKYYSIESSAPLVTLNATHVVLENGLIADKNFFAERSVNFLYNVTVAHIPDKMPASFIHAMHHCIPTVARAYDITWVDDKQMLLRDKKHPMFSIVCNAHKLPDEHLIAWCNTYKQGVLESAQESKNKKIVAYSADIRFEKQIIIGGEKREVQYG